jgi:hypothetical protein
MLTDAELDAMYAMPQHRVLATEMAVLICQAREANALRAEVQSQTARGDVLAETGDNLRKALGVLGVAVATGDVVREANRLNEKIDEMEAEVEALREDSAKNEAAARYALIAAEAAGKELATLRAKAALADEIAACSGNLDAEQARDWLARYAALDAREETT